GWPRIRPASMRPRREVGVVSFSFLNWFRFQLHFAIDDVDTEADDVDVISASDQLALLLHHLPELIERDRLRLSELLLPLFDLRVQALHFLAVRAGCQLHIRISLRRRYSRDGARFLPRRLRLIHRGGAPAEVERSLLALADLPSPQLAVLVVAREQLIEAEAPGILAHLLLPELVDVDLDVAAILQRSEERRVGKGCGVRV